MTDIENTRGRTKPEDDSSDDEEPVRFRPRVKPYANKVDWPQEPLYIVGEVVYVLFPGQTQPVGPYVIVSSNFESATYEIKTQDTGQKHPTAVSEGQLRVIA